MSDADEERLTIDSLPDEVLVLVLKHVPISSRLEHVELVCKRFLDVCRREDIWTRVSLGDDPCWCNRIIYFATGARATLHATVLRACPIQVLDLSNTACKLSASDVIKLVIRHMPQLQTLHARNMRHEHNYKPLYWYAQDVQYAAMLLQQHCSNAVLHLDVQLVEDHPFEQYPPHPGIIPLMDQVGLLIEEMEHIPPQILVEGLSVRGARTTGTTAAAVVPAIQRVLRHENSSVQDLNIELGIQTVDDTFLIDTLSSTTRSLSSLTLTACGINEAGIQTLGSLLKKGAFAPSRLILKLEPQGRDLRLDLYLMDYLGLWLVHTQHSHALTHVEVELGKQRAPAGSSDRHEESRMESIILSLQANNKEGKVPCVCFRIGPVPLSELEYLREYAEQHGVGEVFQCTTWESSSVFQGTSDNHPVWEL